jgi:signal transduction histidine kinase/DNA-binding response OmpR family regulator/ligand-binding sensor domain-containing protein
MHPFSPFTWCLAVVSILGVLFSPAYGNEAEPSRIAEAHWAEDPAQRSVRLRRLTWSRFIDVSENAGLSSNFVYDIDQDDQGFMWFGTRNGLDRYDGYSVKNFRHDPDSADSLSSNDIRTVAATTDGIVWVGSHAAGLDRFDSTSGTAINFRKNPGDPRDIGADQVTNVIEDLKGDIWVVTANAGLAHIDHETLNVTRFHTNADVANQIPDNKISSIFLAKGGRIWVATRSGLIFTDDFESGFEVVDFSLPGHDKSEFITVVTETPDGLLFFQTSNGNIYRIQLNGENNSNIYDITSKLPPFGAEDPSIFTGWFLDTYQRIWMPRFNITYVYDTVVEEYVTLPISVGTIFEDRFGMIWIYADTLRLRKLDPYTLDFGDIVDEIWSTSGIEIGEVFAMLETPDQAIWISDANGVWRYDITTQNVTYYSVDSPLGPDPNDTNALFRDESGMVWAGTFFVGVNRIDPTTGKIRNYPLCLTENDATLCNRVWAIEGDEAGNLWVGSANNLRKYDRERDSFIAIDLPDGPVKSMIGSGVRALEAGRNDTLWIGTESGLLRWQRNSDAWDWIVHDPDVSEGLSSSYINFLHEDNDGGLWIATQLGAHRLDVATSRITRFSSANGLPNDDIHALVEDKNGKIWMSTGEGLASIEKDTHEIKVFDKGDGLSNDEFLLASAHAGQSGVVYFGGIKSVVYFDPDRFTVDRTPPLVAFTELRIGNEIILPDKNDPEAILSVPINFTQSISVPFQRASLTLEFAGMHFADPVQNTYAYKLVGYDDDWTYTDSSRRIATYTNLPFGNYTLHVEAANKHGVWNDVGQSLNITVITPYWRTWWAYTIYGIAFIAAFLLIIRLRTQTLTKRAAELEVAVEDRTRKIEEDKLLIRKQTEELEQLLRLKEKLFTNISHEFRTPLTLILGPVKRILESGVTEKQASSLNLIRQNGQRLLRLVDQLLDLSKLDSEQPVVRVPQPLSQIVRIVAESFVPFASSRETTFETDISSDIWVNGSTDALEKILMNLLSNAFKYTPKEGHVSLRLIPQDDNLATLVVSDSGLGIPVERQQQVFERFNRMNDTGETAPGAGIGLSLVKELVESLDGSIDLKSSPGEGTTFTVYFQKHRGEVLPAEIPQDVTLSESSFLELENLSRSSHVIKDSGNQPEGGLPSVLIIEDNPDMQDYLIELLEPRYSCISVGDGESGVQAGLEQIPDLILCDVMLPKMDGFKVSHTLKSDERTSHIPIIMLTARGDRQSRLHGLREKADDYLAKPFDDEELLLRMQNILDAREILRKMFANRVFDSHKMGSGLNAKDRKFLNKLNNVFERHLSDSTFRIDQMSSEMAMSERTLERKLKALTSHTPAQYLRTYRLNKALEYLRDGMAVYQVAEAVGFSSPAYFTSCFKEEFGKSPTKLASTEIR